MKEVKEEVKNKATEVVDEARKEEDKQDKGEESCLKMYLCKMVTFVREIGAKSKEKFSGKMTCCVSKSCECSCKVAKELQNPVVAANVVIGLGSISALFCGYSHNKRFLKGKSDKEILAILSGLGVFAVADVFLSYRYYKKLEKK